MRRRVADGRGAVRGPARVSDAARRAGVNWIGRKHRVERRDLADCAAALYSAGGDNGDPRRIVSAGFHPPKARKKNWESGGPARETDYSAHGFYA